MLDRLHLIRQFINQRGRTECLRKLKSGELHLRVFSIFLAIRRLLPLRGHERNIPSSSTAIISISWIVTNPDCKASFCACNSQPIREKLTDENISQNNQSELYKHSTTIHERRQCMQWQTAVIQIDKLSQSLRHLIKQKNSPFQHIVVSAPLQTQKNMHNSQFVLNLISRTMLKGNTFTPRAQMHINRKDGHAEW